MSNGIGKNPLNDISKVYVDYVSEKKKDDSYLETDMKKRQANNEKARKDMEKMGTKMKNPHFESVEKSGWDAVNALANAYKEMHEGIRDEDPEKGTKERKARLEKKRDMKLDDHPQYKKEEVEPEKSKKIRKKLPHMGTGNPHYDAKSAGSSRVKDFKFTPVKEGLDPVGKEDGDVNNDGKKDSTDSYLMKRRKAIGKAMKKRMSEATVEVPHGDVKKLASKAMKRVDADVDGDVDSSDMKSKEMGEFVPSADGKKKVKTKAAFEAYSWRSELSEVIMTDDEDNKPIKEKNVKNKIKINPKLGEAVEELGGTLLEMIEVDEFDVIVEEVYQELIEEGFSEDEVEHGIETALSTIDEASDSYYDSAVKASTPKAPKKSMKDRLKSAAKGAIMGVAKAVGKAAKAKAAVQATPARVQRKASSIADRVKKAAKAGYAAGRGPVEKKSTSYRGAGAGRREKI